MLKRCSYISENGNEIMQALVALSRQRRVLSTEHLLKMYLNLYYTRVCISEANQGREFESCNAVFFLWKKCLAEIAYKILGI